jgi:hypothetical protein
MDDAHGGLLRGNPPAIRYKEAALTNQWNFGTDTVTGNITLYAKWTDAVAAIDLSDGTGDNIIVKSMGYIHEQPADAAYTPSGLSAREG